MKKKDLLEILEKSILSQNISTQELYDNYYHLILDVLQDFNDKAKIEGVKSLDVISNKNTFDMFIRSNNHNAIEKKMIEVVSDLRAWGITHRNSANPIKFPDGTDQKHMREDVVLRIDEFCNVYEAQNNYEKELIEQLKNVRNKLSVMFLPKNDLQIFNCYNSIMGELDFLLRDKSFNNISIDKVIHQSITEIIQTVNSWCDLKR